MSGYKVIYVPFSGGKPSGQPLDVLTGFVNADGEAQGRPVGVAIDKAGALLVADDVGNTIWRVTPAGGGARHRQRFATPSAVSIIAVQAVDGRMCIVLCSARDRSERRTRGDRLSVETEMENENASFPSALLLHAVRHDEWRQHMDG